MAEENASAVAGAADGALELQRLAATLDGVAARFKM